MTVTKLVSIPDQEIDVSIGLEDVVAAIAECVDSGYLINKGINNCAQFLKAIPDESIAKMYVHQRMIISEFFAQQSARFSPLKK